MAVLTDLGVTDMKYPDTPWFINYTSADVTTAVTLMSGSLKTRLWIENITVTSLNGGTDWFKLFDGENILVGPVVMANGIPWMHRFVRAIRCTENTDLKFQTQSAFKIHIIIEGFVDKHIPGESPSASVSASPSE